MKSSISVKVQYSGGKPFVITNGARTFLQDDLSSLPTAFTVNGEWYLKLDVIKFKQSRLTATAWSNPGGFFYGYIF